MILGHIGARRGSKGVKQKNKRIIAGKPLIDWSLSQLFRNPKIDAVAVSTDDPELYNDAISKGAIDIGIRPSELATDNCSKWNVWQHSLEKCAEKIGAVTAFVDLDCTAPLRDDKDIDNALAIFCQRKPDMVMSCCIARKNPYFNLVEITRNGGLELSKPLKDSVVARQLAPKVYEHAASTYVVDPSYLRTAKTLLEGFVLPYFMPPERCFDIDTEIDFKIVDFLMKEKHL